MLQGGFVQILINPDHLGTYQVLSQYLNKQIKIYILQVLKKNKMWNLKMGLSTSRFATTKIHSDHIKIHPVFNSNVTIIKRDVGFYGLIFKTVTIKTVQLNFLQ